MTQNQSLEYMENLRGLVQETGYVREPGLNMLCDIREDYEDFRDEKGMEASEAALQFMASAGMIAHSKLERGSDRERFFRVVRDALGARKSRTSMIVERITTGDWWYEGVSETDLRQAYENLDASPENVR